MHIYYNNTITYAASIRYFSCDNVIIMRIHKKKYYSIVNFSSGCICLFYGEFCAVTAYCRRSFFYVS